jgi:hypothetical protein
MEEPTDKVRPLLARLGGAKTLLRLAASDNAGGYGMSEVIGGAGMRKKAAGLSMGQIQSVSRDVLGIARGQVGAKTVDKTVVAFPGLSQFM